MAQKDANLIDESQVKEASAKQFHRFYSEDLELDQPATEKDLKKLPEVSNGLYIFGVPREHPLDDRKTLPHAIAAGKIGSLNQIKVNCQPGEFLVFQIVLWSRENDIFLRNIQVAPKGFHNPYRESETFFNLNKAGGYHLKAGEAKVFWLGMQIFEDDREKVHGSVVLSIGNHWENISIPLSVTVAGEPVKNRGEDDDFRMARLLWLNSYLGSEHFFDEYLPYYEQKELEYFFGKPVKEEIPKPYRPVQLKDNTIHLPGHTIEIGENGLPKQICSGYDAMNSSISTPLKKLLSRPMEITVGGKKLDKWKINIQKREPARVSWEADAQFDHLESTQVCVCGSIDYTGKISLYFHVLSLDKAEAELKVKLPFADAPYMLGLGVKRPCTPPDSLDWHWDPARWEDSFWAGTINNGCIVRLTDQNETHPPLLNCYYDWSPLSVPECWNTAGKGGIKIKRKGKKLDVLCYSGSTKYQTEKSLRWHPPELYTGSKLYKTIRYKMELRLTPFHQVDYKSHWKNRFYHQHMHSVELSETESFSDLDFASLRENGINCINIHHAVSLNPIINYPFSDKSLPQLQKFVEKAHKEGFKVLLYYTVRELTVHCPEFKALYSLEGEIFFPWKGNGKWPVTTPPEGPDPWFKQHLDRGFLPAWTEVIKNGKLYGTPDRSIITTPHSKRLENFYIEGLRFLLERCPIDGLYLDDCDLSDQGMARLKRVFRKYRKAEPILDFHAWESFNSAYSIPLRDAERFPFLTHLWLGEGVRYDSESYENWLIRLSGLPFGLTSEMLGKGNPALGVLFGMTARYGWGGEPRELWKIFDKFGIANSIMELDSVSGGKFGTDHPDVHMTLWKKKNGSVMAAVSSFSEQTETVHLILPEKYKKYRWESLKCSGFLELSGYQPGMEIEIPPKSGFLLLGTPEK